MTTAWEREALHMRSNTRQQASTRCSHIKAHKYAERVKDGSEEQGDFRLSKEGSRHIEEITTQRLLVHCHPALAPSNAEG